MSLAIIAACMQLCYHMFDIRKAPHIRTHSHHLYEKRGSQYPIRGDMDHLHGITLKHSVPDLAKVRIREGASFGTKHVNCHMGKLSEFVQFCAAGEALASSPIPWKGKAPDWCDGTSTSQHMPSGTPFHGHK
jgi:hypothetical protein